MASFTLSDLQADFSSGASTHIKDSSSPYLEFIFGHGPDSRTYKSTMIKHGGARVAWQQPVLLTGASASNLRVVARAHKTLGTDKIIGSGSLDLAASSMQGGFTDVPLTSELGKPAGLVRFMITQGEGAGGAGIQQAAPGSNNTVEGVGGPGRNLEGGLEGAALGAGAGAAGGVGAGTGVGSGVGNGGIGAGGAGARPYGAGGPGAGATPVATGVSGTGREHPAGYIVGKPGMAGGRANDTAPGAQYTNEAGAGYGGMAAGGMAPGGYDTNQQLAPTGQQGMQAGGMGGGMGAEGVTPQEHHEKHTHNVHDHDENETSEVRTIG